MLIKQGTAVSPLLFLMVDSSDHITGKTGLNPTVTISKNGGAFAAPAGAVTEIGNGVYQIAGNATDSNTLGQVWIHATAAGADPCDDKSYEVVASDPQSATVTVGNKTGYSLASDGLDAITVTAPSGVAATFPAMLVQLWRRFFRKSTLTATQLKTYADDGSTVVTTQTVSDDGTTQTQGTAA